jgi:RNA polymerase sigma factor (sigma-70 family)
MGKNRSLKKGQSKENYMHSLEDMNEQLLWEILLSGDKRAYSYFYKKYVEDLFAYGMRFTFDQKLVEDCIQDVFIKLYDNRSKLSKTVHVKLYLFIALKNTIFDFYKKDKAHFHLDTMEPVFTPEYNIEEQMIANEQENERREKMNHLLDLLTPRQREVIYYRYVEGIELNDICKLMNMNYQSIQNLVQRSIKKIKSSFAEKKEANKLKLTDFFKISKA